MNFALEREVPASREGRSRWSDGNEGDQSAAP